MKDDSGAYAVFTRHGSSASQMTAAKVMDVNARLPTKYLRTPKYRKEDAPKLLRIPKSECADMWIRIPRHRSPTFKH